MFLGRGCADQPAGAPPVGRPPPTVPWSSGCPTPCGMVADAGVGLHGLIWVSPLGWVEELRPLTDPSPVALVPIALFTGVAGRSRRPPGRAPGRRGRASLADRTHARPRLRLLTGPTGLAVRLARPTVIGWWVADRRRRVALRADRQVGRGHHLRFLGPGGLVQAGGDGHGRRRRARRVLPRPGRPGGLRRRRPADGRTRRGGLGPARAPARPAGHPRPVARRSAGRGRGGRGGERSRSQGSPPGSGRPASTPGSRSPPCSAPASTSSHRRCSSWVSACGLRRGPPVDLHRGLRLSGLVTAGGRSSGASAAVTTGSSTPRCSTRWPRPRPPRRTGRPTGSWSSWGWWRPWPVVWPSPDGISRGPEAAATGPVPVATATGPVAARAGWGHTGPHGPLPGSGEQKGNTMPTNGPARNGRRPGDVSYLSLAVPEWHGANGSTAACSAGRSPRGSPAGSRATSHPRSDCGTGSDPAGRATTGPSSASGWAASATPSPGSGSSAATPPIPHGDPTDWSRRAGTSTGSPSTCMSSTRTRSTTTRTWPTAGATATSPTSPSRYWRRPRPRPSTAASSAGRSHPVRSRPGARSTA